MSARITDVPSTDAILAALYLGPADVDALIMRLAAAARAVEIDARMAWSEYVSQQLGYQVAAGMVAIVSEGSGPRVFAINHAEYGARIDACTKIEASAAATAAANALTRAAIAVERIHTAIGRIADVAERDLARIEKATK